MTRILNFIGGHFDEPIGGEFLENPSPRDGKVYSTFPDSDARDVAEAVKSASAAFSAWSGRSASERAAIMIRIADLIRDHSEDLARAESIDSGKPLHLARTIDIPRAEANMRFFAAAITQFSSEAHLMGTKGINYTNRKPVGIVGCISPWNLPLYLFTWKIAPAMAAGNCVIAKPSEITPMTAYLFSELCKEAGLPDGVLHVIHGLGPKAGQAIVEHPEIKAISFTGGTKTGQHIAACAAPMFKKLSLELGGKNAALIFEDADFDKAVSETIRSSFTNQGQICLCTSRILVQRSIYNRFRDAFVQQVQLLTPGDPQLPDTRFGALSSEAHRQKVRGYIHQASADGGRILTGGEIPSMPSSCANGYYLEPTVIEGLSPENQINQEEVFGPVVTMLPFDTEEEALVTANGTPYGLAATVWTNDLSRAHRVAAQLETGIVWINTWLVRDLRTPFGGVKNSGVGREGGQEALRFFTEPQNVCLEF